MIYRIEVRTNGADPVGDGITRQIAELGISTGPISTSRIFLIDTDADRATVRHASRELLADPIVESLDLIEPAFATPAADESTIANSNRIEVHLKPGVMDPVAASTEMALRDLGLTVRQVRTGRAYLLDRPLPREQLTHIASRTLANGVIESVHFQPFFPASFETGRPQPLQLRSVNLRSLTDEQLIRLSRDGHLFLSLTEMRAIQTYFREHQREPTDIELETLAQTWSEHCVHKTLKSTVEVSARDESGQLIETRRYDNLIKETIFDSTMQLIAQEKSDDPFCLSVFKDNAGVIVFDETDAVCFKVETHNHPSAIEPYGGSATGAGGVIRDVLGTGLAAKPIANTDVFCVGFPNHADQLPRGVIHPKRVLQQVVAGVRDYGNRMGIPTVNGAVYFDDKYLGNPLVFCGCLGLIPRNKIEKAARPGDAIMLVGGRTGRDGIHGATFSSAELTDTHADEFSHAVQIGNAITEKKVADVILAARDRNLFTGITDCGAGGLSSAVGEMAEKTGAFVQLETVPLKYDGLRYDEIWISEAQERMVLSVPLQHVAEFLRLAAGEDVEATVIGSFGTDTHELILRYDTQEVGRISMAFLHDGLPMPTRRASVIVRTAAAVQQPDITELPAETSKEKLLAFLAHPNIASKHWVIRQYDHEVQGGSVIKPLIGPLQMGPSDAAVIRPKPTGTKAVALGCGLAPQIDDPYDMAIAAIDEAIRNVVAVGADPARTAILDNFCWPSVDDEQTMGTMVRACEACRDAALAYRIPFVSGKDSLHNQFTNQETGHVLRIPRTLLISAMSVIADASNCVTMDFKAAGNAVVLVESLNPLSPHALAPTHRAVAALIADGKVAACHDVSDGGVAVAAAEMCIASGLGLWLAGQGFSSASFTEQNGRYLLELAAGVTPDSAALPLADIAKVTLIGHVQADPMLQSFAASPNLLNISVADMTTAWRRTLDW